jgi:hypothetical protein
MAPDHRTTAVSVITASLLVLLAACSDGSETRPADDVTGSESLGHVHGLGTDPADGAVYAATHFGVFNLGKDGAGPAQRVADRWQDTMAFTVIGPDHFLASGHPDQREDLPVHLGLIESTDAARTWEPVSLHGEADFHALEAAGDLVYGYDSVTGRLMVTTDRRNWRILDQVQVADLAADPSEPARVLAATVDGVVTYRADDGAATPLNGEPPLALLDWPVPDLLVGASREGDVYRSSDAGETWHRLNGPAGELQALDVTPSSWHLATDAGIFRSTDDGRTWQDLSQR